MDDITIPSVVAAGFAKSSVDLLRMMYPRYRSWMPPVVAILFGVLGYVLAQAAAGAYVALPHLGWTQGVANAILMGWLAGTGAVGITAIGRQANDERRQRFTTTKLEDR